jgi:hypothetical protein
MLLSSEALERSARPAAPAGPVDLEWRGIMPKYMDVHHKIPGLTAEAVAGAHQKDLEVQGTHGVDYQQYWFDEKSGTVFCLVEAPSKEAAEAVHRAAHGLVADEIVEVKEGA